MTDSRGISLQELEKLYTKNRPITPHEDTTYDTLKISKDELNKETNILINPTEQGLDTFSGPGLLAESEEVKEVLEAQNFLASDAKDAINYKYSTPVRKIRQVMRIWRIISLSLILLTSFYLGINFWATVGMAKHYPIDKMPWPINWFSTLVEKEDDYLYWSYIVSSFLSCVGMIINIFTAIMIAVDKVSSFIPWSKKANAIVHICYSSFVLVYLLGISFKMFTILLSNLENKTAEFIVQFIKGGIFIFTYISWRRTIRLKYIHSEMVREVLEMAKDNKLLYDEVIENWEKIDD
jgi:hypothetical protein